MVRRGSRLSYSAPHQRLKFPESYLTAATGRAKLFKRQGEEKNLKKGDELCN